MPRSTSATSPGRRRLGAALVITALVILAVVVVVAKPFATVRHVTVVTVVPASTGTTPYAPPPSEAANGQLPATSASVPPRAAVDSSSSVASVFKPGAAASFARLAAGLGGSVELAVAPVGSGRAARLGGNSASHAWSTSKVPVLVALLRARGALSAQEREWARLAITQSDNQSILDLFGDLERSEGGLSGASRYIEQLFRASGDLRTVVATAPPPPGAVTTFGQTRWAPSDSVKFFRALGRGCLLPPAQTAYILGLMRSIVPSESWGLGSGGFTVPVAFKGGWGPEPSGYLVRQGAIIDPGTTRGLAVSIVVRPRDGSFGTGTQMLTTTARWLRGEVRLTSRPTPTSCSAA